MFLQSNVKYLGQLKSPKKFFPHEEYVNLLLNNLTTDMAVFDEASLERNEEILLALKEVKGNEDIIIEKITGFLSSRDDNVRMAALECLEEHAASSPKAKEIILKLAQENLTDENSRFLGVVNSIIQNHKWM